MVAFHIMCVAIFSEATLGISIKTRITSTSWISQQLEESFVQIRWDLCDEFSAGSKKFEVFFDLHFGLSDTLMVIEVLW